MVERAVEGGLLGDGALTLPDEVSVPDKYTLLGYLGRGGAGRVYLARDTLLDRRVAIKFLTDARSADVARFRREARVTARLSVPSIVQIYEMGESGGAPFIAMQYLEGGNLEQAELDEMHVARVARQVATALSGAHRAGIVHRDIKPANILLDAAGKAFVTDFGIARDLTTSAGPTLSTEGQIMGTPALMPPEQARGDLRAIDARSDVYALGATLFLKLTGRYPFERDNVVDVLHAVLHDEPPLPRSLRVSIPRSLEALILRCMQKRPLDRYGSMKEVIDDLDAYLDGAASPRESGAWFGRLVRTVVGAPDERPAPPPADDSRGAELEILRELSAWDVNLYRVSRDICRHYAALDQILARTGAILAARPETAWARFYRGIARFRRGRLPEALDDIERSIDRVEDRAGGQFELGRVSLALYLRAQHEARQHLAHTGVAEHLQGARSLLDQAVDAFEEAGNLSETLPRWQVDMARAVRLLAEEDYDGCVRACDAILEREPEVEEVWKLRGDALELCGREPFESYDRAIDIRRAYHEASFAAANAWLRRGDWQRARTELLERALRICPEFVDGLTLLARTHLSEAAPSSFAAARAALDRAIEIDAESYGAVTARAEVALIEDRLDDAARDLERATELAGCQNRVNLLRARVLLARARTSKDIDLAQVLQLADEAERSGPNPHWQALRAELRELGS
jgi:tetratricopeptide (TPR) repeat protein/predicted Ser/Thr protein kinase